MQKRKLGNAGTLVSAIGVGGMSFTDFYGPTDTEKSHLILNRALDLGIDHIDTSNLYGTGLSEERIGSFLKKQGAAKSDLFKIATKASIGKDANGVRMIDNSSKHLEGELDKSLMRLGVDQVEIFYVHRREADRSIEEVTETLARLVKSGKTRQVGYSEIAPTSLVRAAAIHPIGAVQSEYSLSTRAPELGLVQKCAALGTTLVAFSPVGRGLLTDTRPPPERIEASAFLKRNPRFLEPNLTLNIQASEGFRKLAGEMGVASATLAIAWLLHQGGHIVPIPGTRSVEHLEELARGAELTLSPADLDAIGHALPVGWAHGDRYTGNQWVGPERFC